MTSGRPSSRCVGSTDSRVIRVAAGEQLLRLHAKLQRAVAGEEGGGRGELAVVAAAVTNATPNPADYHLWPVAAGQLDYPRAEKAVGSAASAGGWLRVVEHRRQLDGLAHVACMPLPAFLIAPEAAKVVAAASWWAGSFRRGGWAADYHQRENRCCGLPPRLCVGP